MIKLLSIKEASDWASQYLNKNVTSSNISYLIQYGVVKKYFDNGRSSVNQYDLINYYDSYHGKRETEWKEKLGNDLNWHLSFDFLKEKDTTKHIHRIHPYKGKFIPQLVEYFLDNNIDNFKKEVYFNKGDIILDPFSGSGTTLVQSNELGIHSIGIDVSVFNTLIANVKIKKIDFKGLEDEIETISKDLNKYILNQTNSKFEYNLSKELNLYNKQYFPSPEYKVKVRNKDIIECNYTPNKVKEFNVIFDNLIEKHKIQLKQNNLNTFLDKWYSNPVRKEIDFVYKKLNNVKDIDIKNILTIILSRTIRTCRSTTHADLSTLKEPVFSPYYCKKHGKICKPLFSILSWWKRYSKDTMKRLKEFDKLRTNTLQHCLQGDARNIDIISKLEKSNPKLSELVKRKKIKGIFSSPPYVGLIDYHKQHAYAYDLFDLPMNDELEIGPLFKGQGIKARNSYIDGVSQVLLNTKKYLVKDYDIFLVANDKYNMYQSIAQKADMKIVNQFNRPVLNRTEKNKSAYSEIIFHLKSK
jgi:DNA modification methylase